MDILLYGPTGKNIPTERIGGAEVGVKRSIEMLENHGLDVYIVEKPTMYMGKLGFFKAFIKAIKEIRYEFKDGVSIFYLVGFYDKQIIFEFILTLLAQMYHIPQIYEPKNGAMIWKYKEYGVLYKTLFKYIIKKSDVVFCQGKEYKCFLESLGYNNAAYHPNYVNKEAFGSRILDCNKRDNFIYVGRITESKNIELIIEIYKKTRSKGINGDLYLVGGFEPEYKEKIDTAIKKAGLIDQIHFTGRVGHDEIYNYLSGSKYFLFPTKEKFEGHSNSLTEAMALGVVPIVSNMGFNRSVVGNDFLVLSSYDSDIYAEKILQIERENKWNVLSDELKERVVLLFSEEAVRTNYLRNIDRLLNRTGYQHK